MTWTLHEGDCLEIMPTLPDHSIDMILCDLPYGTTACSWDVIIPFEPLWAQYKRLIKPNGAIVLTGSQPFTSLLVCSNLEMFRYAMVWDKVNKYTDFLNAKKRPMRRHEDVLVFGHGPPQYYPQKIPVTSYKSRRSSVCRAETYGQTNKIDYGRLVAEHNPCTVIEIEGHFTTGNLHPTQKPVALLEYLIQTYTRPGDTILDNCAGSGTTGEAAEHLGRNSILIEREAKYCEVIRQRMGRLQQGLPFAL